MTPASNSTKGRLKATTRALTKALNHGFNGSHTKSVLNKWRTVMVITMANGTLVTTEKLMELLRTAREITAEFVELSVSVCVIHELYGSYRLQNSVLRTRTLTHSAAEQFLSSSSGSLS